MRFPWWGYVILAGLAWGTYVPIIFYGGSELGGKSGSRLMAILCVGVAYFVLAVSSAWVVRQWAGGMAAAEDADRVGSFGLAGVAGAIGAICVVFASKAAMECRLSEIAATNPDSNPASYRQSFFLRP